MGADSILIANRGEIAVRIMRTARRLGYRSIAVYSEADAQAMHVLEADAACYIGPAAPAESYLRIDAILDAARKAGATAVHPGYGFLAERPEFAQACLDAGLVFIGPSPESMRVLGNKAAAKHLLEGTGVPILAGYAGPNQSTAAFQAAAHRVGFPLMIKAAAGGGGRGMRLVRSEAELDGALRSAGAEALAAFGDGELLLERALLNPRHVEVQIFGDRHGNVVHLGERDCSVQRRHQKVIEEAPSPAVRPDLRRRLGAAAIAVARAANYVGAGTVEFLLGEDGTFYFIEVNTRLQVEHPVTEAITGIDLVEWQIRVARGEVLPRNQDEIVFSGHAIEARLCAEDPARDFLPQSGQVLSWLPPPDVRVDHALYAGAAIPPHYDSMVAKLIAHAADRDTARLALARSLDECVLLGLPTNRQFLARCLRDECFAEGGATTGFIQARYSLLAPDDAASPDQDEALGAALLYLCYARRAGHGEWTGWSNTARTGTPFLIRFGEAARPVRCVVTARAPTQLRIAVGDSSFELQFLTPVTADSGAVTVGCDGVCSTIHFVLAGRTLYYDAGTSSCHLEDLTDEPASSCREDAFDGLLRSPISGRVLALPVAESERAEAGRVLVVLEAMKMEHSLVLPVTVRVETLSVRIGSQVAPGDLLLQYERTATPAG